MSEAAAPSGEPRKVLVTGAKGMLGSDVCQALSSRHRVRGVDIDDFDITDLDAVGVALAADPPDVVIHCAAWTDVDGCEREPERAFEQNAGGARNVAGAAAEVGAEVVYVSTDYVFDGEKGEPYTECDAANPLNVYGASKLAGEEAVRSVLPHSFIVRSAWLFGAAGGNFVAAILKAAAGRDTLRVVGDQFGSPTYTKDLARAMADLIVSGLLSSGTYHLVNSGVCSWAQLASEALAAAGSSTVVEPISSAEWPSPARRPPYSVLRSRQLEVRNLPPLRDWREALKSYLKEVM
jgi:dTDP-4-dehydrorhamnose reductase